MTPTPKQFENLDRLARLAVLAEVQHHEGVESDDYRKLARVHEFLLNRSNGYGGGWRPTK
jgi:hypothetical protein